MSDGKRLGVMAAGFVVLQVSVLFFIMFFLGVRPDQAPGLIHYVSLSLAFVLAGISFWMLRVALRPHVSEPDI